MSHEDFILALSHLGFDNGFSISGNEEIEIVVWEHDQPKPTNIEVQKALKEAQEQIIALPPKESALIKLQNLGLTEEEARAIAGV
jgi:hypothetical protein